MGDIIRGLLNLSIMNSFIIILAIILRFFVNKWERRYTYFMWIAVFVSLCIPSGLYGPYSLVPQKITEFNLITVAEKPQEEIQKQESDQGNNLDNNQLINPVTTREKATYVGKRELTYPKVLSYIWILGFIAVFGWNIVSMLRLKIRTRSAWKSSEPGETDVWICDRIAAPFILGVINPKIYIPTDIGKEERAYILAHERYHQKRFDHISKVLAFLLVSIFWFNPLVWLAYAYFIKDLEFSCDEAVVRTAEYDIRKKYAESLLKYAAKQNRYILSPLTFAEPSMKTRILHVLKYKKKSVIGSFFVSLLVLLFAIGLIFKPEVEAEYNNSQAPKSENEAKTEAKTDTDTKANSQEDENSSKEAFFVADVDLDNDGNYETISVEPYLDNGYSISITYSNGDCVTPVKEVCKGFSAGVACYIPYNDSYIIAVEMDNNSTKYKNIIWAFDGEKFVNTGEINSKHNIESIFTYDDNICYNISRDNYYRERISYRISDDFTLERLTTKREYEIPQEKIVYDFQSNIDSAVEYDDYYELEVSAYSPEPRVTEDGDEYYEMGDQIGKRKLRFSKNLVYIASCDNTDGLATSDDYQLYCDGELLNVIPGNLQGFKEMLSNYYVGNGFTVDYRGYIVELYN